MLIFSVISIGIVIPLSNNIVALMLLTAFGFLLSRDLLNNFGVFVYLIASRHQNRISRAVISTWNKISSKAYKEIIDFRSISPFCVYLASFSLTFLKGAVLLVLSLLGIYFTSTLGAADTRELLTTIFSGCTIGLCVLLSLSDILQQPYYFGMVRNFFYPKLTGTIAQYKLKRERLQYASVPRKIVLVYSELYIIISILDVIHFVL